MLIAHVQYIGAESMASRYAYQISLFDTDSRQTGHKFEGLVTSTMKPLESQCSKEADIFVTTFHQAKNYTDQWANLNFIITMKKLEEDLATPSGSTTSVTAPTPMESTPSTSSSTATPTPAPTSTPAAPVASTSSWTCHTKKHFSVLINPRMCFNFLIWGHWRLSIYFCCLFSLPPFLFALLYIHKALRNHSV